MLHCSARLVPAISICIAAFAAESLAWELTPLEQAQGWKLLTGEDGVAHWRAYRGESFPAQGWTLKDGVLTHAAGGGGGDIVTREEYGDFELVFEFRTAPKANSGVIYRVSERHDAPWMTGPEFQILDDAGNALASDHPHSAGAMYDLYVPVAGKQLRESKDGAGSWNEGRIIIRNGVVQHWINGVKIVEARMFDDEGRPTPQWVEKIAGSKFKDYEGFGLQPSGRIAFQDHGDEVSFRHVKVRRLGPGGMPSEVQLFNGRNLDGLVPIVPEAESLGIDPASVWSVKDGVLICAGNPAGYIRTAGDYTNFILKLEWRFSPVTKAAGNSGVLFRMVGEDVVWPRSVEAQLMSGSAGDFFAIGDFPMTTDPARRNGRHTRRTHTAERPVGEWNEYEIILNKGDVVLIVNGEEVNRATGVEEVPGKICLQSEGVEIHFRNVRLTELK